MASDGTRSRILVVDDEREVRDVLEDILERQNLDVETASTCEQALTRLETSDFDVVLADHYLGDGMTGVELCGHIAANWPTVPTIILTAYGNIDIAISALRAEAFDFLTKPCRTENLVQAVRDALDAHEMRETTTRIRREHGGATQFGDLVGESSPMRAVFRIVERAKDTDLAVLISGESGTGKDLLARALHDSGRRKDGPFEVVRCQGRSAKDLAGALFGRSDHPGALAVAAGGTLVLDEVGELDDDLQSRLVRALQGGEEVPRVICTTTRDLAAARSAGKLRDDLYYRISALDVRLPPLRDRGNDVLVLAQRFLAEVGGAVAGIDTDVAAHFLGYRWPGNVRELRNVVNRAAAIADHKELHLRDLPEEIRAAKVRGSEAVDPEDLPSLADLEQEHIARVLTATGGNKQKSARILGVDRSTLYRKMARYGIVWAGSTQSV